MFRTVSESSMNTKERDAIFQHWRSLILRETRDLASLERVGARALQDREVRADATLESLIRTEVAERRADIEREQQSKESADRQSRPAMRRSDYVGGRTTSPVRREPRPQPQSLPPPPVPPSPPPAQLAFDRLAQTLRESLARGDAGEAGAVYEQMQTLQEESRDVIPAVTLERYEQQIAKLRARLEQFRIQIAELVQQAIAASGRGDEPAAGALIRRLSAIHVTYPHLLDDARLDEIRADIVHAGGEHEDSLTARKLVERERAVSNDIQRIAVAVHEFHRVVCEVPDSSAEFRSAEAVYLRTLQEVRAHDTEWLAGFVLELADLLAEWSIPSRAAGKQIDDFLESIRLGLKRIHAEMGSIDSKRAEGEGSG
jgi:hypothetical protein